MKPVQSQEAGHPSKNDDAMPMDGHRYLEHLARFPERLVEAEGEGFFNRVIRRMGLRAAAKSDDDCGCAPPGGGH